VIQLHQSVRQRTQNNDCGGVDGDTRRRALADMETHSGEPIAGWKHRPANSRFNSGPQSLIEPQSLAAPERVTFQTASREDLPTPAGDDFGFFQALPLAIAGGLALWGLIVWALI